MAKLTVKNKSSRLAFIKYTGIKDDGSKAEIKTSVATLKSMTTPIDVESKTPVSIKLDKQTTEQKVTFKDKTPTITITDEQGGDLTKWKAVVP